MNGVQKGLLMAAGVMCNFCQENIVCEKQADGKWKHFTEHGFKFACAAGPIRDLIELAVMSDRIAGKSQATVLRDWLVKHG